MVVVAKFWWKMVVWVFEREKEREKEREREREKKKQFLFFIFSLFISFDCVAYIIFFELYVKIRIEMLGALLKRLIK